MALHSGQRKVIKLMTTTLNIFFFFGQFLGFSGSPRDVQLTMILPSSSIVRFLGPVGPFSRSAPVGPSLMTEAGIEVDVALCVSDGLSSSLVPIVSALEVDPGRFFPIAMSCICSSELPLSLCGSASFSFTTAPARTGVSSPEVCFLVMIMVVVIA